MKHMGQSSQSRATVRWLAALAIVMLALAVFSTTSASAQGSVTITITPACCGSGWEVGTAKTLTFSASGGTSPYSFSMTGSSIPGLSLSSAGVLSGTPRAAGSYDITITATDSKGNPGSITGTLVVAKMTPTISVTAVTTSHPDGTFMAYFPVSVAVQFNGYSQTTPSRSIEVLGGSGDDDPTCTTALDSSGEGICDLIYPAGGSYDITINYPAGGSDANYNTVSDVAYSGNPLEIQPYQMTKRLSAGRFHSCFMDSNGKFTCWGLSGAYQPGSGGVSIEAGPVLDYSAGGYHTCWINTSGALRCWGDNPDITDYPGGSSRKFVKISAGRDFACAIDTRARLWCWGTLPDGLNESPSGSYKAVSAGDYHACALTRSSGALVCWGDADEGSWEPIGSFSGVKSVSAGPGQTCIVTSGGSLRCWGLTSASPPSGSDFVSVQSGSEYSCAQRTNNRLACWGTGPTAAVVDTLTAFEGFSAGYLHACAWNQHSPKPYLSCWGTNSFKQAPRLALSPAEFSGYINYIPLGGTWNQTFTGTGGTEPHLFAMISEKIPPSVLSGATMTWQPGVIDEYPFSLTLSESSAASSLPVELAPLTHAYTLHVENAQTSIDPPTALASAKAGDQVTVSVKVNESGTPPLSGTVSISGEDGPRTRTCQDDVDTDGSASCNLFFAYAGENKQISASYAGNGFYTSSESVAAEIDIEAIQIVPVISAGNQFNCALDNTGLPACWGKNDALQTVPVEGVYDSLSSGDAHACGRSLDAGIYCWGWDGYGLPNSPSTWPIFKAVASGSTHACGLTWWGGAYCWGNSAGNRTTAPYYYNSLAITAGDNHTCALTSEWLPYCWGINTGGQLNAPAVALSKISAGGDFTCGITASGSALTCWGGSAAIRAVPAGSFLSLDAGTAHACAVRSDNQVLCWGDNTNGKATPPARTFSSVSAGKDHTCGVRLKVTDVLETEAMECWGNNSQGQAPVISITPAALNTINVDSPAAIQISAGGGRSSVYAYSLSPGSSLPAGLELNSATGLVHGTPTTAGTFNFTIRVLENGWTPALIAERSYTLTIRAKVALTITAVEPAQRMAGLPVTIHVRVAETPGGGFTTPPAGTVTVRSDDGKTCQAALTTGADASSASCTIYFTSAGSKALSADYPQADHFLAGSTAAPTAIDVDAFSQQAQIRTTPNRTYIHRSDGTIFCIGTGCALGDLTSTITTLSAGESLACGLGLDGFVRCREAILPAETATLVRANGPYIALAAGSTHACAIRLNGSVFCWGANGSGQATPPAGSFTALSANTSQTCGIRSSGELACWGSGPTPPAGSFTALSLGGSHACAIATDKSLACWGDNSAGQSTPPAGSFMAVSAGGAHTCALDLAGHAACWGDNSAGQSGPPYGVYTALSAAADHACALRGDNADPRLTCWGGDQSGEAPRISVAALADSELVAEDYWEFAFNPTGGNTPYTGSVTDGLLPQGITVRLSEAGVMLYGTPDVPGDYPFVLLWEDDPTAARPIPLALEKPYTLRVTGSDLAVSIQPSGAVAMANNIFRFAYTFRTKSALSVPAARIKVELPDGLAGLTASGIPGCVPVGLLLDCVLPALDPAAPQVLTVEGKVTSVNGGMLATSAEIQPTLADWHELSGTGADNAAEQEILIAYNALVYEDALEGQPLDNRWTGGAIVTSPGGVTYLGDLYSDSALRLVIDELTPHKWVEVSFDLYLIGPWLGNNSADPANPSLWRVGETGLDPALATTFCNQAGCSQAFPAGYPGGAYPAFTSATGADLLGYPGVSDSRYHISLRLDHSAAALDLTFMAQHLPVDARWGLDNIQVKIDSGVTMTYLPVLIR